MSTYPVARRGGGVYDSDSTGDSSASSATEPNVTDDLYDHESSQEVEDSLRSFLRANEEPASEAAQMSVRKTSDSLQSSGENDTNHLQASANRHSDSSNRDDGGHCSDYDLESQTSHVQPQLVPADEAEPKVVVPPSSYQQFDKAPTVLSVDDTPETLDQSFLNQFRRSVLEMKDESVRASAAKRINPLCNVAVSMASCSAMREVPRSSCREQSSQAVVGSDDSPKVSFSPIITGDAAQKSSPPKGSIKLRKRKQKSSVVPSCTTATRGDPVLEKLSLEASSDMSAPRTEGSRHGANALAIASSPRPRATVLMVSSVRKRAAASSSTTEEPPSKKTAHCSEAGLKLVDKQICNNEESPHVNGGDVLSGRQPPSGCKQSKLMKAQLEYETNNSIDPFLKRLPMPNGGGCWLGLKAPPQLCPTVLESAAKLGMAVYDKEMKVAPTDGSVFQSVVTEEHRDETGRRSSHYDMTPAMRAVSSAIRRATMEMEHFMLATCATGSRWIYFPNEIPVKQLENHCLMLANQNPLHRYTYTKAWDMFKHLIPNVSEHDRCVVVTNALRLLRDGITKMNKRDSREDLKSNFDEKTMEEFQEILW